MTTTETTTSQGNNQPAAVAEIKEIPRKATVTSTTFNTLCNIMGGGILSLPFAMYNGSIIISIILLIISGLLNGLSTYVVSCGADLLDMYNYSDIFALIMFPDSTLARKKARSIKFGSETQIDIDSREPTDEIAVAEQPAITNPRADRNRRILVAFIEVIICLTNFGALIIYSRVISDSWVFVLADFFKASGVALQRWLWYVVFGVVFFVVSCARSITELKFISIMGFLTILYVVFFVFVRYFTNKSTPLGEDSVNVKLDVLSLKITLFSTISAFALSFAYQFNVPFMYQELVDRRPSTMLKTVIISTPIVVASYFVTALFGYLTFGVAVSKATAGGNIMNNYSNNDIPANIGRLVLVIHFIAVYPMLAFACRRCVHKLVCKAFVSKIHYDAHGEPRPPGDPSITNWKSIIIEALVIVALSTLLAALVPGIGFVIELIGTICVLPIMLIFPGCIGIKIFKTGLVNLSDGRLKILRVCSFVMLALGIVFFICGLISFGISNS